MSDKHLKPETYEEYGKLLAANGVVKFARYTPRGNDSFSLHIYMLNEKNELVGVKYPAMYGEKHYCGLNIYDEPKHCREEIWNNLGDYQCWEAIAPLAHVR